MGMYNAFTWLIPVYSFLILWIVWAIFLKKPRDWNKEPWTTKDTVKSAMTAAVIASSIQKHERKKNAQAIAKAVQAQSGPNPKTWAWDYQNKNGQ